MPVEVDNDKADFGILTRFKAIVTEFSEKTSLTDGNRSVSYAELDRQSDRIAQAILPHLAGNKRCIVTLPRSIEAVVSFLGILKAGGCYVPIDPSLPRERLHALLEEVCPDMLLCRQGDSETFSPFSTLDVSNDILEEELEEVFSCPQRFPDTPAYINFTSGSTGKPKGVLVPDRGILRLVLEPDYVCISKDDTILHFATTSFDAATFEIWGPLLNGASMAILAQPYPSASDLGAFIRKHDVSISFLTSGLFNAMIDSNPEGLSPIRQLLTGGEVMSIPHIAKASRLLHNTKLSNVYGPTENTTFTTFYPIPEGIDIQSWKSVPIGKAIQGTSVFVLDEQLNPVGVNCEGELVTGGEGVALGYFNDPDLSRERFVEIPSLGHGKFYRTGDIVTRNESGFMEFVGRRDEQVKINGFRIELGEISHRLKQHETILDAVVIPVSIAEAQRRLVAYVVSEKESDPAERDLSCWLGEQLPSYMVPTRIITLPGFPLNQNGKVDRKALPNPFEGMATGMEPGRAFSEISKVIQSVLNLKTVDESLSFLQNGGDSLSAIRLVEQARRRIGISITVDDVLSCNPISQLSKSASTKPVAIDEKTVFNPDAERPDTGPLSIAQEQLWFLMQSAPDCRAYNVNCRFKLAGNINRQALVDSIRVVFNKHPILATILEQNTGDELPRWKHSPDKDPPVQVYDLSDLNHESYTKAVREQMEIELATGFELMGKPLIRWVIWDNGNDEINILQAEHHLIHDGWSLRIILRDWLEAYKLCSSGLEHVDESPSPSYLGYSKWQHQCMQNGIWDNSIAFWKTKLQGFRHFTIPPDKPREKRSYSGRAIRRELSHSLVTGVRHLSRSTGHSEFEIYLTAFVALLREEVNWPEINLGIGVANRQEPGLADIVGMFVNMSVLRLPGLEDALPWSVLLHEVSSNLRELLPHQHIPFEQVVRSVNPDRKSGLNPFFEVLFSMHHRPSMEGAFRDTLVEFEEGVDNSSAKFDHNAFLIQEIPPPGREDDIPRVWFRWEYRNALFNDKRMEALVDRFILLVEKCVAQTGTTNWKPAEAFKLEEPNIPHMLNRIPSGPAEPSGNEEEAIRGIWQDFFPTQPVDLDSNFFHMGGHSLLAMRVIAAMERKLDRSIPMNSIFDAPTPRSFAALLRSSDLLPMLSLNHLNSGSGDPFVFIHGWGGDAYTFLPLAKCLDGKVSIAGLQADPEHGRSLGNLNDIARSYADYLDNKLHLETYRLGGYSIGGIIAWATALELQKRGRKIGMLAVLDSRPLYLSTWMRLWANRLYFLYRIHHHIRHTNPLKVKQLSHNFKQRWRAFRMQISGSQRIQPATTETMPGVRSPYTNEPYQRITEDWDPESFNGELDLFWSHNTKTDLPATWRKWIKGDIRLHRIQGHHLEILGQKHVHSFAETFREVVNNKET